MGWFSSFEALGTRQLLKEVSEVPLHFLSSPLYMLGFLFTYPDTYIHASKI